MNKLIILASYALALIVLSCGAPQQAGGSDMPNGKVSGIVVSSTGTNTSSAKITLKTIRISPKGETDLVVKETTVNANGAFAFTNVENGNYIISATVPNGESAILSRISKTDDPLANITLTTAEPVSVHGCVVGMNSKPDTVFIPGTGISAPVDEKGFYTLNNIPTGDVEIAFSGDTILTVLPVTIEPKAAQKRVNIRNCSFANNDAKPYAFHQSTGFATIAKTIVYAETTEPEWYAGTDFSGVIYPYTETIDSRANWNFPVVIEVTQSTINYYGGSIDEIKKKINTQFAEINNYFRDPQFTGKISFSVDSVGSFVGTANDLSAPKGYSLRLILDGGNEIAKDANWDDETRTGIISYDNNRYGGVFGDSGTIIMKRILAQSRGAKLLSNSICGTQTISDIRSEEQFSLPSLLLWGTGGTSLDNQSVAVINKNSSALTPSYFPSTSNLPTTISMFFTQNGAPISEGSITVIGVNSATGSLHQTATYTYGIKASENGRYSFPDFNPFKIYSNFSNFKIELVYQEKSYTFWLPQYEASASWFSGRQLEHISHFEL